MASERRRAQVAQRVRQKVSELLLHEMKDPRATFITVTRVEVSSDLSVAKISWSTLEPKHRKRVEGLLRHAAGF